MREILFRGKDIHTKKWVTGYYVCIGNDNYSHFILSGKIKITRANTTEFVKNRVISETVGQYTGLTDKNGKQIFEGDIIVWSEDNENYVIKYSDKRSAFIAKNLANDMYYISFECGAKDVTLIGNIHDNPELLTQLPKKEN